MNEDYLWDKSGRDPEIEKFERALRPFAHRETSPPALPTKVVSFPGQPSSRLLRYAMAAAACLVFLALSFGVWMQFSARDQEDEISAATPQSETGAPKTSAANSGKSTGEAGEDTVKPSTPDLKTAPAAARKIVLPVTRKNIAGTKKSSLPTPAVKLTKEEEYAYGQLKLALSITGSKLKLIRDKIDSGPDKEDKNAAVKTFKNGR